MGKDKPSAVKKGKDGMAPSTRGCGMWSTEKGMQRRPLIIEGRHKMEGVGWKGEKSDYRWTLLLMLPADADGPTRSRSADAETEIRQGGGLPDEECCWGIILGKK